MRSDHVTMGGTDVHLLRVDGPEDRPTQLLVHGLGGSATNWLEVAGQLAEHGPVVAPDLPGFGRTAPPHRRGSRVGANVAFLEALIATLDLGVVQLHGNSMGGMLAVQLAARRPDLVERLVLVDPALPGPRTAMHQLLSRQAVLAFAPFLIPGLGHKLVVRLHRTRTAEQLFDDNQDFIHADPTRVRPVMAQVGRENVAFAQDTPWRLEGLAVATESVLAALLGGRELWRAVDAVRAPTLLLWGDQDRLIGQGTIDATLARQPDWELHVLERVGHVAMVEAPERYLDLVTDWYARTPGGRGVRAS